jgi:DNA-binding transcriptional LysR family regulator
MEGRLDRLDGMQAFVAVAETGGFSAAAARLGVARALVSKRIAALERELKVRLLNRTTRRVSLTGAGQEFLGRSQRILAEFDEATGAIANLQLDPAGSLKISAGVSFATRQLAPVAIEFMAAHPRLLVELQLNDRFVDPVEEGFDVCVRVGEPYDSSLIARRLATVRRVLCASPGYLDKAGVPTGPADLERHAGLHYCHNRLTSRWRLGGPAGAATVELPSAMRSNNGEVLLAAALAGHGIANLPTFIVADALRAGTVVPVLPSWRQADLDLTALWPASRYMPRKLRVVVDFLASRFADPAPWDEGLALDAVPVAA